MSLDQFTREQLLAKLTHARVVILRAVNARRDRPFDFDDFAREAAYAISDDLIAADPVAEEIARWVENYGDELRISPKELASAIRRVLWGKRL